MSLREDLITLQISVFAKVLLERLRMVGDNVVLAYGRNPNFEAQISIGVGIRHPDFDRVLLSSLTQEHDFKIESVLVNGKAFPFHSEMVDAVNFHAPSKTCRYCKGTGTIFLVFSNVPCECRS